MVLNRKCRGGFLDIFTNTTTVLYVWLFSLTLGHAHVYIVDDYEGLGRRFDGIGGLSGGGVRFLRRPARPWNLEAGPGPGACSKKMCQIVFVC